MELRHYWVIIKRRMWLIVLIFLITLAGSLVTRRHLPLRYRATMRFMVGVVPQDDSVQFYGYDRYYTWLASEYLVDDLAEVVRGQIFARRVAMELSKNGVEIPPQALYGTISADTKHRVLSIHLTWHNPEQLVEIAQAVTSALEKAEIFFPQLGTRGMKVELIDPVVSYPLGPSLREKLDLPLRLLLALLAGVALAFLLDYLDESIHDREELEEMGLEVLAEIPSKQRWPWLWW